MDSSTKLKFFLYLATKMNYEVLDYAFFLQPHVTFSLVGPNILVSMLFSNILSQSSPRVKEQASHPNKTIGKMTFLQNLYVFI
jgi:hypothetical protein